MKPKVMIVEDQEMVMEQICDFIEWVGCEVVYRARNGKEAINAYKDLDVELVTMDLMMPEMDGAEATRRIIEMDPEARIIVFTSLDAENEATKEGSLVQTALTNGAMDAVCKFSKTGISHQLKELFGDRIEI